VAHLVFEICMFWLPAT